MRDRLDSVIEEAVAVGILPHGAAIDTAQHRPWPILLLTGLGAWLAAIPLFMLVFLFQEMFLKEGNGNYVLGIVLMVAAALMLRVTARPLFVEQLAFPVLIAGAGILGKALFADLRTQHALGVLAMLPVLVAVEVPRQWLRILLGAAACGLMVAATGEGVDADTTFHPWLALHAAVAAWLCATRMDDSPGVTAFATGWGVAALAGLAIWTGMTFLVGAHMGNPGGLASELGANTAGLVHATSIILAAAGAMHLGRAWPSLNALWAGLAVLILMALSAAMPPLGAALLIIAVAVVQHRWLLATTGGVAAAWIIGAFYYRTEFPLATQATILVAAGTLLGLVAWMALRNKTAPAPAAPAVPGNRRQQLAIAASLLAVLAVANVGIAQKERLIAVGKPIFVELMPVDPRSLMQGDYMTLGYAMPPELDERTSTSLRRQMIAKVDERGVATLLREAAGTVLKPGQIVINVKFVGSRWVVATDAWHFKEGQGNRWSRARYAEFRVDDKGRALLVDLRGPILEKL